MTAPRARSILIALQLFSGDQSSTGSYKAHQYVVITRVPPDTPVDGLGDEAFSVYAQPGNMSFATVTFRWGNAVAVIQYGGSDSGGATRTPIGRKAATSAALALARKVFDHLRTGSSGPNRS